MWKNKFVAKLKFDVLVLKRRGTKAQEDVVAPSAPSLGRA